MAEKIDKEVCTICLHDFNRPRKLDCSHTFCYICLEDYINRTSENGLFHCPLCRQEFSLPEGGVEQFMSDVNIEDKCGNTDVCIHHPKKRARCYCRSCKKAVCSDCFVSEHSGHVFIDLQSDDTRGKEREELQNLNQVLETELTRHQHHLNLLQTMITNINISSEAANDRIDEQVKKICSHVKKLGEEIKEENEKLRREEKEKIRKPIENSETLVEDLKASIKHTGNILEDKLMVQVIERKAEVEKVTKAAKMRKLDLPDVNYPWFEKGKIEETQLSEQLGKLTMKKRPTFTSSFNFGDEDLQSGKLYIGDKYNIGGLSWCVGVQKATVNNKDTLGIYLNLTSSVKSCYVEFSLKLINHKDIRESVERHLDHQTFTSDYRSWGRREFIDWNRFSNKENGFLTEDNKFTVQATVKVLKIER